MGRGALDSNSSESVVVVLAAGITWLWTNGGGEMIVRHFKEALGMDGVVGWNWYGDG